MVIAVTELASGECNTEIESVDNRQLLTTQPRMTQVNFTTPNKALLPVTVYYDHSCLMCRSEIENIAVRAVPGELNWIDCSVKNFDTQHLPFNQTKLMNSIHAVDTKGEWLVATDVFIVCYRSAQMNKIANLFAFAKPVLNRVYPLIAKHRSVLSSVGIHKIFNFFTNRYLKRKAKLAVLASQSCRDNACDTK